MRSSAEAVGAWFPPSLQPEVAPSESRDRAERPWSALAGLPGARGPLTLLEIGRDEESAVVDAEALTPEPVEDPRGIEAEARASIRDGLTALEGAARALREVRERFERTGERDIQALALAAARQIAQRELTTAPEIVGDIVRRALDLVPPRTVPTVRLHPDDLAAVTQAAPIETAGGEGEVRWAPDPSIERGGFLIEAPPRIVDGKLETVFRILCERMDHD